MTNDEAELLAAIDYEWTYMGHPQYLRSDIGVSRARLRRLIALGVIEVRTVSYTCWTSTWEDKIESSCTTEKIVEAKRID